ncbi:hypothetical protein EON76_01660 [bacterium]|nr:MAG: hypothetical protein EON76_01660 [bacterium]
MIYFVSKKVGIFAVISLLAVSASAIGPVSSTANAQTGLGGSSGLSSGYGSTSSTCAIETVGWVICPIMRSIALLADYGFAFINQNFLRVEYDLTGNDSGVYKTWQLMLSVANVIFVIAFLWVIYTQITGRNSGGYSIKRMLPRLIIGAIMVNLSYIICVLAIDASNVAGDAILDLTTRVGATVGDAAMSLTSAENGFNDSRLTDITTAVLSKFGTVWILLAPVAAVTVSIAVICAAGLVLLIMRKVVISMFILISPLIFVAYLLPNLERVFQQWGRLFFQLLLIYPVIAFLLGTGQIISATIVNVGSGGADANYSVKDDSYNGRNGGSGSITTDLAASGAAVLPLIGVWFILKNVSSAVSTAGSKFAANVNKRGSKSQDEKMKAKLANRESQGTKAGAAAGLPSFDRRPAFSRLSRKRKATKAGSVLPSGGNAAGRASKGIGSGFGAGGAPAAEATDPSAALNNTLGQNPALAQFGADQAEQPNVTDAAGDAAKKLEQTNTAKDENGKGVDINVAATAGDDKKEKGKTAKDIFNNLSKSRQMGGGQSSGNGGQGGGSGQAAPSGPSTPGPVANAPISLPSGGGTSQQSPGATAPQIIAVPVQVDAASFLSKEPKNPAMGGMMQPPTSDIEKKAKARAQKYIFDSATEVKQAEERLDILNNRDAKSDEPPTPLSEKKGDE